MGFDPVTMLAASTVASSLIGSHSSNKAASQQVDAANNATALQKSMFDQTQQNLQPYMQGGSSTLATLLDKIKSGQLGGSFTPADFLANKDPGYEFQLKQGQQALMNSQAAGNGALSGAALKSLIDYNQGAASTGYQNAYNRWLATQQNAFGQLSDVAKLGENAAAGLGNTGVGYANGISSTLTGAGNAAAAGTIGSANAIGGGLSTLGSLGYLRNSGQTYMPGYGAIDNANLNNPALNPNSSQFVGPGIGP